MNRYTDIPPSTNPVTESWIGMKAPRKTKTTRRESKGTGTGSQAQADED